VNSESKCDKKKGKEKGDGLLWVPHTDVTTTGGEKTPIFRKKQAGIT